MAIQHPDIDPVAISFGPVEIRWYALSYLAGFVLAWAWCFFLIARSRNGEGFGTITRTDIDDFFPWAVIGVILGGRLGYVLFYNAGFYFSNPLEIVKVWQGGMAFHGGLIGAAFAMFLYARVSGVRFLHLADLIACAAPIGLFFGRIANFINAELIGRHANVPWAVIFPDGGILPRHPSQIYEALLEGLLLFIILSLCAIFTRFPSRPGMLSGLFLTGYGLTRSFAEFFREPDAHIGYFMGVLTMGQILCVPMILLGLVLIVLSCRKRV